MQLSVSDVAKLCSVSENTVYRWVQQEGLPAENVNSLYRVNPAELLEWATTQHLPVSPAIFQKMNGDSVESTGLTDALEAGGVVYDVPGDDRRTALAAMVDGLPLANGFDGTTLVELLLAREHMGGTAVGDGIAIPHPRNPVVLPGVQHVLRVGYLSEPIDFGASDGKPVDTLFLMICPTVHDHLQLLARLANVLRHGTFRELLSRRPDLETLVGAIRSQEQALFEEAA